MFRGALAICCVSRRFFVAVREMFHHYDGALIPPIVARHRAARQKADATHDVRKGPLDLGKDHFQAVIEVGQLLQCVLPRVPLISEIDFGGCLAHCSKEWLLSLRSLPAVAPRITKLDLSMVQGIRDFAFIAHYAPTLTTLCLSDVSQQPNDIHSPFEVLSRCHSLGTLVLAFRVCDGNVNSNKAPQEVYVSRADFGDPVLNTCNRLGFLDAMAGALEHLRLDGYHFSVNRAEDHSLAKASNLKSLTFRKCKGLRHIFFVRWMRDLEYLSICSVPIAHRRSERTLRMLADLPNLKTLLMEEGFWVHHSSLLAESHSLRFIAVGGRGLDEEEWEPAANASGEPLHIKDTCYGFFGEDCFPDSQMHVSDTDDEYLY